MMIDDKRMNYLSCIDDNTIKKYRTMMIYIDFYRLKPVNGYVKEEDNFPPQSHLARKTSHSSFT